MFATSHLHGTLTPSYTIKLHLGSLKQWCPPTQLEKMYPLRLTNCPVTQSICSHAMLVVWQDVEMTVIR